MFGMESDKLKSMNAEEVKLRTTKPHREERRKPKWNIQSDVIVSMREWFFLVSCAMRTLSVTRSGLKLLRVLGSCLACFLFLIPSHNKTLIVARCFLFVYACAHYRHIHSYRYIPGYSFSFYFSDERMHLHIYIYSCLLIYIYVYHLLLQSFVFPKKKMYFLFTLTE